MPGMSPGSVTVPVSPPAAITGASLVPVMLMVSVVVEVAPSGSFIV